MLGGVRQNICAMARAGEPPTHPEQENAKQLFVNTWQVGGSVIGKVENTRQHSSNLWKILATFGNFVISGMCPKLAVFTQFTLPGATHTNS